MKKSRFSDSIIIKTIEEIEHVDFPTKIIKQ